MGQPYWINRWPGRGKDRRGEVKQRGEMREERSRGGMWRELRRGKERTENNKDQEVRKNKR